MKRRTHARVLLLLAAAGMNMGAVGGLRAQREAVDYIVPAAAWGGLAANTIEMFSSKEKAQKIGLILFGNYKGKNFGQRLFTDADTALVAARLLISMGCVGVGIWDIVRDRGVTVDKDLPQAPDLGLVSAAPAPAAVVVGATQAGVGNTSAQGANTSGPTIPAQPPIVRDNVIFVGRDNAAPKTAVSKNPRRGALQASSPLSTATSVSSTGAATPPAHDASQLTAPSTTELPGSRSATPLSGTPVSLTDSLAEAPAPAPALVPAADAAQKPSPASKDAAEEARQTAFREMGDIWSVVPKCERVEAEWPKALEEAVATEVAARKAQGSPRLVSRGCVTSEGRAVYQVDRRCFQQEVDGSVTEITPIECLNVLKADDGRARLFIELINKDQLLPEFGVPVAPQSLAQFLADSVQAEKDRAVAAKRAENLSLLPSPTAKPTDTMDDSALGMSTSGSGVPQHTPTRRRSVSPTPLSSAPSGSPVAHLKRNTSAMSSSQPHAAAQLSSPRVSTPNSGSSAVAPALTPAPATQASVMPSSNEGQTPHSSVDITSFPLPHVGPVASAMNLGASLPLAHANARSLSPQQPPVSMAGSSAAVSAPAPSSAKPAAKMSVAQSSNVSPTPRGPVSPSGVDSTPMPFPQVQPVASAMNSGVSLPAAHAHATARSLSPQQPLLPMTAGAPAPASVPSSASSTGLLPPPGLSKPVFGPEIASAVLAAAMVPAPAPHALSSAATPPVSTVSPRPVVVRPQQSMQPRPPALPSNSNPAPSLSASSQSSAPRPPALPRGPASSVASPVPAPAPVPADHSAPVTQPQSVASTEVTARTESSPASSSHDVTTPPQSSVLASTPAPANHSMPVTQPRAVTPAESVADSVMHSASPEPVSGPAPAPAPAPVVEPSVLNASVPALLSSGSNVPAGLQSDASALTLAAPLTEPEPTAPAAPQTIIAPASATDESSNSVGGLGTLSPLPAGNKPPLPAVNTPAQTPAPAAVPSTDDEGSDGDSNKVHPGQSASGRMQVPQHTSQRGDEEDVERTPVQQRRRAASKVSTDSTASHMSYADVVRPHDEDDAVPVRETHIIRSRVGSTASDGSVASQLSSAVKPPVPSRGSSPESVRGVATPTPPLLAHDESRQRLPAQFLAQQKDRSALPSQLRTAEATSPVMTDSLPAPEQPVPAPIVPGPRPPVLPASLLATGGEAISAPKPLLPPHQVATAPAPSTASPRPPRPVVVPQATQSAKTTPTAAQSSDAAPKPVVKSEKTGVRGAVSSLFGRGGSGKRGGKKNNA